MHYSTVLVAALLCGSLLYPSLAQVADNPAAEPRLIDPQQLEYFLLQATTSSSVERRISLNHIGVFTQEDAGEYRVTAVLDDYPAQRAGLRPGDRLLSVDDSPFHPVWSFNSRDENIDSFAANVLARELVFERNGTTQTVSIEPVFENLYDSVRSATLNSQQQFNSGNKVIGYIRLWSLSRSANDLNSLEQTISSLSRSDGLVLDLRDSYGFISAEHLDHFFPSRNDYFDLGQSNQDIWPTEPAPRTPGAYFDKAMVIIINGNTRGGMELFAYQLGKLQRVVTLGEPTSGQLGTMSANADNLSFTYVAHPELTVDGLSLEGTGVTPENIVSFPLHQSLPTDPQLEAALAQLMAIM